MFHSLFLYFFVNLERLVICLENSKKKQNKEATLLEEIFMQAISLSFFRLWSQWKHIHRRVSRATVTSKMEDVNYYCNRFNYGTREGLFAPPPTVSSPEKAHPK